MTSDDNAIPTGPPVAGNEIDTALGELERVRGYIAWKSGGLDAAGMRATLPPSTMTLGGLLKHLALVEDHQFGAKLTGAPLGRPWSEIDWDAEPDWDFQSAAGDSARALYELWDAAAVRSRERVAEALAGGGLDQPVHVSVEGTHANLRRLVCDMIEEYGRHTGHADLIREAVDGRTGEDPSPGWRPTAG